MLVVSNSSPVSLSRAQAAFLCFAIVAAIVSIVLGLLAAFQAAPLVLGGSHSCCQHRLTHCELVLCPGLQM